jgi:Methyltransferase domain
MVPGHLRPAGNIARCETAHVVAVTASPRIEARTWERVKKMAGAHSSARYLGADFLRLLSYRYQLVYATRAEHASVLVVGKGDGLVPGFLRSLGANVLTADINRTLRPDIISDVRQLSLVDAAVDVSMCCQVLEHLPFDQFRAALTELRRVTRLHLILSLPDVRRHWRVRLEAGPFVLDRQGSLPRFQAQPFPTASRSKIGHRWEIGFRGFPFRAVGRDIESAGWEIVESARVHEFPWHTFFYCRAA